jgi:hypothetical protein
VHQSHRRFYHMYTLSSRPSCAGLRFFFMRAPPARCDCRAQVAMAQRLPLRHRRSDHVTPSRLPADAVAFRGLPGASVPAGWRRQRCRTSKHSRVVNSQGVKQPEGRDSLARAVCPTAPSRSRAGYTSSITVY